VNLDAYFARTGFTGATARTVDTLNRLALAHVKSIPFENLDVLLNRPINLDDSAVDDKLLTCRRGGYCFEQNTLMLRVLQTLGFDVEPISARVRYQRPREFTPPRTHVFLKVTLNGEVWFVDVGVGAMSPTSALRFVLDEEQATPHEPRRFIREDGRYFHQAQLGDAWVDIAEFTLEGMPAIDREVANWFTSAHPQSHFKSRLMAARALDDGRVSILNREFTLRRGRTAETRVIESPEHLLQLLNEQFALVFPEGTRFACPALDFG
jgi:N-hydroxyarylamine O-acetyltransferase